MKVLIIRFSSIGDIVLTTPVVRCLKKQRPDLELHYLTRAEFLPVLAANPYLHTIHPVSNSLADCIPRLQEEKFDVVIDLHHNLRSAYVKNALGIPVHSFYKANIEKWLMTAIKINILPRVHLVDRYLDTVRFLGVQNDQQGLDYFIAESDKVPEKDIPISHQAGYIGVVIGAAVATKQLPTEQFRELCQRIRFPIILLGGAQDRQRGEEIKAVEPEKIYNACGKFRLNESADLVRRAKLIVTQDTGLMHIAAAFQKPVLSIWGNTIPAFGMYPYYGTEALHHSLADYSEVKHLWCRPCSKIGYSRCPLGHFRCMRLQPVQELAYKIHLRLGIRDAQV